jgi:membrane protease YdiL (CAAX protease family)
MRSGTARGCQPWGPAATLAWGFGAVVLWLAIQIALGHLVARWMFGNMPADAGKLAAHAPFVAAVTISGIVVPLALIALAVRMAGCSLSDYLGLYWPSGRYLAIGIGVLAMLIPLVDLISWLAGYPITPSFVLNLYRSGRDTGTLIALAIALSVAAPVIEETIFRGFLLPGLAQSALRPAGAILLSSIAWAALHLQYQPFYLIQIVILGAAFGWLRLRSGSTLLTMLLHGLLNLASLTQAGVIVEWAS